MIIFIANYLEKILTPKVYKQKRKKKNGKGVTPLFSISKKKKKGVIKKGVKKGSNLYLTISSQKEKGVKSLFDY